MPYLVALVATTGLGLAFAVPSHRPANVWRLVFYDNFRHHLSPRRWGKYSGEPGGDPGGWWAPSHAFVRHHMLVLASYRDRRFGDRWVSGGVSAGPALKQTYGRYEVRMRVDAGRGVAFVALLWPAGKQWPPEIDFAENGGERAMRDHMTATLHYGAQDRQVARTLRGDFSRWHTLGVEWTPGQLAYTVDGHLWAVIRNRHVPAQPMELDLQTETGTCGQRYTPCPDSTTPSRVSARIAWVAAYAYGPGRGRR